jgi:hypothetical protein
LAATAHILAVDALCTCSTSPTTPHAEVREANRAARRFHIDPPVLTSLIQARHLAHRQRDATGIAVAWSDDARQGNASLKARAS